MYRYHQIGGIVATGDVNTVSYDRLLSEIASKAAIHQGDDYRDKPAVVFMFDGQAAVGKYCEHRFVLR